MAAQSDRIPRIPVRQALRWRAVAGLVTVAGLSALLLHEGFEATRIDLIAIGGVLLFLSALALVWKPRAGPPEEDPA